MSLRPSTDEVLSAVVWSFEHDIVPTLDDEFAQSTARTISNLLRHLQVRIRHEGQTLVNDNLELRELLKAILTQVRQGDIDVVAHNAVTDILAEPPVSPPAWASVARLTDEALQLRRALDLLVQDLIADGALLSRDGEGGARTARGAADVRRAIESYLGRSLRREALWNVDPFQGDRR
jgi:hypothetical protein